MNTPTNTLREQIAKILNYQKSNSDSSKWLDLDEYGNPVNVTKNLDRIESLISQEVNKARLEELEKLKKLHTRLSRQVVTDSKGEVYSDSIDLYISEYEVRERIAQLKELETPNQNNRPDLTNNKIEGE